MSQATLFVGAGHIERTIEGADVLLRGYRRDIGCDYLDYRPVTPSNALVPEDLAVTLLVNSQAGYRAFRSLRDFGTTEKLDRLPQKALQETTEEERRELARLIAAMAQWPGFGASLATKVLHKKRPDLIPILDNQAIFGAYMTNTWPERPAQTESVKDEHRILKALDWIAFDITRPDNSAAWELLLAIEPNRTRIQLFDSVWWMHFRLVQPV